MTPFVIMTSPGTGPADENARFIADRFSWLAFVLPVIWFLWKRQWLAAFVVFCIQGLLAYMTSLPGGGFAGLAMELAVRLLIALECSRFLIRQLEHRGWVMRDVIPAPDMETAEDIYYHRVAGEALDASYDAPLPTWPASGTTAGGQRQTAPAFGLFETYGER